MKAFALFLLALLALLALPLLLPSGDESRLTLPEQGLPWQVERLPDGATRVFGLVPGRSTLAAARALRREAPAVALIVAPGDGGSLEAYYESFAIGALGGKLVLTLASSEEERVAMLTRARKAEYMESTTRRITLAAEDLQAADARAIIGIAFIPAANLDERTVIERFGAPAERIPGGEQREHFLYPDQGLDLQLDGKGKEVLQYVAPADFERLLRAPLRAAASAR